MCLEMGEEAAPREATLPIPEGRGHGAFPLRLSAWEETDWSEAPTGEAWGIVLDTRGPQDQPGTPTPSEQRGAGQVPAHSHPRMENPQQRGGTDHKLSAV